MPALLTVNLGYGMKFTLKVDLDFTAEFDSEMFLTSEMLKNQQTFVDLDSIIE